jgi:hypothetical protein
MQSNPMPFRMKSLHGFAAAVVTIRQVLTSGVFVGFEPFLNRAV